MIGAINIIKPIVKSFVIMNNNLLILVYKKILGYKS